MNKMPDELWAKSNRILTLEKHLHDAENAAQQIFRLDRRWGQNWCRFFQIQGKDNQQKFLLNLQVAALFHDIGKANEDFYTAVTSTGFFPQVLRHEHLSALILCLPQVRTWLGQNPDLDVDVITAAVLSHHLKASKDEKTTPNGKSYRWSQPQSNKPLLQLYLAHSEVVRTLDRIAQIAHLNPPPSLPTTAWKKAGSIWDNAYRNGRNFADRLSQSIRKDKERQRFLVAVKAGLIASDAAASGLVREKKEITEWIEAVAHSDEIAPDEIATKIIQPRLQDIQAKDLREFQKQLALQGAKTLLLSACGSGKTLAAWKWAEVQSQTYTIGKVIFLYPTRGTATEGFRDYVGWAPETDAALITGTARYELEAMRENPEEESKNSAIAGKIFRTEADERLYALGFWSKRFFSATVDQFLSFMEHSYHSLCLLPVLADSAVIIDEVHSFDRSMFDTLISFLKTFDIPVLCMTATLPKSRRKELEEAGLRVFPTETDRVNLDDLKEKEEAERYYLEPVANFDAAFDRAVKAYQSGLRVLWVVNTVDRCLAISHRLENHEDLKKLGVKVLTYHSRFRLCDRAEVHKRTVAAFAPAKGEPPKAAIAVTTQVCEMSLDLDADVLITEVAPISAMVQRFGRANRHLRRDFATLHVYEPPSNLPYSKEELSAARTFLDELGMARISQYRLAQALEDHSRQERNADGTAPFLTSGYYATPGSLRDTEEFAVPCILDQDLEAVKAILDSPKKHEKEKFIINVPKKWATQRTDEHHWLPKYLQIAQWDGHYDKSRGFQSQNLQEVELG
ncbi:CRISPR-associated helicase Cas3' [Leptothermofonsia sichuanensis E412]|uniref:CRISPR-associated helicase Cas3' n=1 Tax=Leptothermofonsia sichuanensis TaxID=2917832 RepID=UPI001CA662BA|nr:CRISPR-associated helicase Cas3' [Leptothermofonsia sichuanensis]QZZ22742.1 CRISPR-associated helicase Cas3' [Leptothermofonsia sichuanensis E412]